MTKLPKILYNDIPGEIFNASALNHKIHNTPDKNSPYPAILKKRSKSYDPTQSRVYQKNKPREGETPCIEPTDKDPAVNSSQEELFSFTEHKRSPRPEAKPRQASISWDPSVPEEWTVDNVVTWLRLYQFNESWIQLVRRNDIIGNKFLALQNYSTLKEFHRELDFSNDSSPSRFIHLLRKTLDKPLSGTKLKPLASPNSSVGSSVKLQQPPVQQPPLQQTPLQQTPQEPREMKPTTSAPTYRVLSPAPVRRRFIDDTKVPPRPFSTIESSSSPMVEKASPSSPHFPSNFFRRHQKSSSSESSLLSNIFPGSSADVDKSEKRKSSSSRISSTVEKLASPVFRNDEKTGLFNKLRKKPPTREKKKHSFENSLDLNDFKFTSIEKPKTEPLQKYKPIPKGETCKYILVTNDNKCFFPLSTDKVSDTKELKSAVLEKLHLDSSSKHTFHITEFGCDEGMPLDEKAMEFLCQSLDGVKLCVRSHFESPLGAVSTRSSTSRSFEGSEEGRQYPATPQYLLGLSKEPVDYINFKSRVSVIPEKPSEEPISSDATSIASVTSRESFPKMFSGDPNKKAAANAFKVIRSEIDFDRKRESPYERSSLIAKRSAPPPPLDRQASFSRRNSMKKGLKVPQILIPEQKPQIRLPSVVTPVAEDSGSLISPFTPGSSVSLVPKPYEGIGKDKISHMSQEEAAITFAGAPELSAQEESSDEEDDFFAKKPQPKPAVSSMAVRPPAEVVFDNLELFFPNTDLDRPIVDDPSQSPISPIQEVSPVKTQRPPIARKVSSANPRLASDDVLMPPTNGKISPRMKTIRLVAKEANEARKKLSETPTPLLRRASTKMWGQKVVEVTSEQAQKGYVSKLKNHRGEFKQFAWVKGELIGKGTFGSVHLALNVTTGEMMAVKQVNVPRNTSQSKHVMEVLGAMHSEVETMKDLDHLNIVQYLGFERKHDTYSLFLEYVAGGSVGSCLRMYGRFQEDLIRFLTLQVLRGLAYLHSRGILHRDLKADNLLLEIDGVCKISDFGISKRSKNIYANDAEMSMQGTIFWMAPEVIDNAVENNKRQGYSAKVDIWSLGCVVLEMFAGRRPWSNLEAIGAIYKLGKTKLAPPIPEDTLQFVSLDGQDFIQQCFQVDPEKRPTAEKLLNHPFCKLDEGFSFEITKLAEMIRFNDKHKGKYLRDAGPM